MKNTLLATAAMTILASFAGSARADEFEHIDGLAAQIQTLASRAASEAKYHFRGTLQYRHLTSDLAEMNALAAHIHEMVHQGRNLNHIRKDVASLDRIFHHVEDLVNHIRPANFHFHGGYGFHGGHWNGPSREDLRRMRNMLARMEDTIHHLQEDLQVLAGGVRPLGPVVNPVPYQVRIGNGNVRLSVQIP